MKIADAALTWEQAVTAFRADPENRESVLACFYDDPLIVAAERYYQSSEWSAVLDLMGHGQRRRILDIGAGRGVSSYAFARAGWEVTALEPDPSCVVGADAIRHLAKEACVNITVVQEWGERLPFADSSFDAVYCRAVLHHSQDLVQLCMEVARVLKPGGCFLASREHVVSNASQIAPFQASHPLHALYGGEFAYTIRQYRSAILSAGLIVSKMLTPMGSDINLFPTNLATVRARWASRISIPSKLIPDWLIVLRGKFSRSPGRLYTFLCEKPTA